MSSISVFPDNAQMSGLADSNATTLMFENTGASEVLAPGMSHRDAQSNSDSALAFHDMSYSILKRSVDVLLSGCALIILSPLFVVIAAAVWFYDGGNPIFSQTRVGKDGRRFRCFKFRSMVLNAEEIKRSLAALNEHTDPRTFKMKNDPRVTPPGRIIRRFSLDELPQIFNVFIGDMSIVGPRPAVPSEVELYTDSDKRRLAVKPGLTCIWQVSGRSRIAFPQQVELDVEYIRNRSFIFDLKLILKTIPAVLSGDGAV